MPGSGQATRTTAISQYSKKTPTSPVDLLSIVRRDFEKRNFAFNSIFKDNENSQSLVFEKVGLPIIDSVLNGMSGSILAYGQTGTGKTYTMIGEQDGILPSAVNYILENIESQDLSLSMSAIQIYNEQVGNSLIV